MKKKTPVNRIINAVWALLIVAVLALFLYPRFGSIPDFLREVRRSSPVLKKGTGGREMTGFDCDFTRPGGLDLWLKNNVALEVVDSPPGLTGTWLRAAYYPAGSPGLLWTEETLGLMDWRRARVFSFRAYNPQSWTVDLKVKVKDVSGRSFQKTFKIPPFRPERIEIPIPRLAGELDAGRIVYLNLFLWSPSSETTLYYSDFAFEAEEPLPEKGVRFMGLEFPSAADSGEEVNASFYFITHRPLESDLRLVVRLERGGGETTLGEVAPPLPAGRWPVGKLVKVGPLPLVIPESLPPGNYALKAMLASPEGATEEFEPYENPEIEDFTVGRINVTNNLPR